MNNAATYMENSWFKLKAILFWTIHDFIVFGIISGCVTKSYKSCSIYRPRTISKRSAALKKHLNDNQYRKSLSIQHPWKESLGFDRKEEWQESPIRVIGEDILRWEAIKEGWKEDGGIPLHTNPVYQYRIKKVSGLYQLWYWKISKQTFVPRHQLSYSIYKVAVLSMHGLEFQL